MNAFTQAATERGFSLRALARASGLSASLLSQVAHGSRRFSKDALERVAAAMKLSPPELLERIEAKPANHLEGFAAARAFHAANLDFALNRAEVTMRIASNGDGEGLRRYVGCGPHPGGRPLNRLSFLDRVLGGSDPDSGLAGPRFAIEDAPESLCYDIHATRGSGAVVYRLDFPGGWSRRPGDPGLTFTFRSKLPGAYVTDPREHAARLRGEGIQVWEPPKSCFCYKLAYFSHELIIRVELECGWTPPRAEAWAWWDSVPLHLVERNLIDQVARSHQLTVESGAIALSVLEPLPGYTFAVAWPGMLHDHGPEGTCRTA